MKIKEVYDINDLREIMKILRSEDGCPWDKEQDHHSIRKNFIEETYEVIEAIDEEDTELLCEELGDVLMQVMFHSQMETEVGNFTFDDVCDRVCKKLIHRHPHVFSDVVANDTEQVLKNWEQIKNEEKKRKTISDSLNSVPKDLPALMRAQKLIKKGRNLDNKSSDISDIIAIMKQNLDELEKMVNKSNSCEIDAKIGQFLFETVNFSEKYGLDCEKSLTNEIKTYINRLRVLEQEG